MSAVSSTKLPPAFRKITLELGREPQHPHGDASERYILIAPLTDEGRIDADLARDHHDACRVVREGQGDDAAGHLVHGPGGIWRFHYDVAGEGRDEVAFRLASERLVAGEYISVVRPDGPHPFRVTAVGAP